MLKRNIVSWGTMMAAYSQNHNGDHLQVIGLCREMVKVDNLCPNKYILATVVSCCSNFGLIDLGRQCHAYALTSGLVYHHYVKNALVNLYSVDLRKAMYVLDSSTKSDICAFNSVLNGLLNQGDYGDAFEVLCRMVTECGCDGWDNITCVNVLGVCAVRKDLVLGRQIHCIFVKMGSDSDHFVGSASIDTYGKCGEISLARKEFDGLDSRNVIVWTAMLNVYLQNECFEETVKLFLEMEFENVKPNDYTFAVVLNSCACMSALGCGNALHARIEKTGMMNYTIVPVANGNGSYPFTVEVPRYTRFLFSNRSSTPSKAVAKSIVYLLKPGGSAQTNFANLVNLLEQYYHPSNGGRWTYSLERFLFHLVNTFMKRLQHEQLSKDMGEQSERFLAPSDRASFVNTVLKIIDRGQYSKNENLSETVASTTSILSFLEPNLVLPFLASRFHMALETTTATHQLKSAVTSVAFAGRSLLFTSSSSALQLNSSNVMGSDSFAELLMISLSNALLGMDANDPPKTLATMQLIGSLFSSMATLDDSTDVASAIPSFGFSEWLDEFLCRLFSLLQHLEPSSVLSEGAYSPFTSGTFLVEDGPYYFCMLEILFGRLSDALYKQMGVARALTTGEVLGPYHLKIPYYGRGYANLYTELFSVEDVYNSVCNFMLPCLCKLLRNTFSYGYT